jgi:hypothetical protein
MIKIFLTFTLMASMALASPTTANHDDHNLLLLVKRKFTHLNDTYLDDEYYRMDAQYLRSADLKCVLTKLNLVDSEDTTLDELQRFNAQKAFDHLEEDFSTLAIYTMYSCIDDVKGFTRHYFSRVANDTPRYKIPRESSECAKSELVKMGRQRPLVEAFAGLVNHTQEQCDSILFETKAVNESWDDDYRGCLKIYDLHSLEYALKFAIMRSEKVQDEVFESELAKYTKESRETCETFVECMIEKYL